MAPQRYGKNRLIYWASIIDGNALEQAARASRMPFVVDHVALMPDAHVGMGATVGSVIPTKGAVIPAAVGVDLGCGMIATETAFFESELPDDLQSLLPKIAKAIPAGVGAGFKTGEYESISSRLPVTLYDRIKDRLDAKEIQKASEQYGSLGSGNHFVEICVDEYGVVWTVLHSGSRGIGNLLASKHISLAKKDMKERFISLEDPDLAYFVENTPEFEAYIHDMMWSQDYAWGNRQAMNAALQRILVSAIDPDGKLLQGASHVIRTINCHHNYTTREVYNGQELWITRKGAIDAHGGTWGVIPGSMGTDTFIVRGLGNPASWNSSSHGAGRKMSRGQAKRELDVSVFRAQMEGKAWQHKDAQSLLDESPGAYKDIQTVMDDQKDLSEVTNRLHQRLNYKGL
jgi:tRNA-splicing ligase RtcB